ncbi:cytochrome P450 [Fomes fomentarius]|nr:cytochrome P450 [Fomes fomentarius]
MFHCAPFARLPCEALSQATVDLRAPLYCSPVNMQPLLLAILLSAIALGSILARRRSRSLKYIRGPASPSWIFGHDVALNRQEEVGDIDFACIKEYGATWRLSGHLGTDVLMTADPKALQHIFHKSGYNYAKRRDITQLTKNFLGPGIVTVGGETHQRQRKIMNPAFSAPQLRTFLTLFQDIGLKMCEKWKAEVLDTSEKTVFVNKWLARTTLDIIGAGEHQGATSEMSRVYNNLLVDTGLHIPKWLIFYRTMWNYLPDPLLNIVRYTPNKGTRRVRHTYRTLEKIGSQLLDEKMKQVSSKDNDQKDVLSILIRANMSENPKTQLEHEEIMAQMQTLTFAGHETTASTLSWMFWELAKHPSYQTRMREEIRTAKAALIARGGDRFTIDDLDSMTTVLNAIKETLRVHPIVFNLQRVAVKDDIIPLSEPITTVNGEVIDAIPVKAGQWISASLCGYNRLSSVWGKGADEWDPDRFLRIDTTKQTRVGVFANLMSFSAGIRACIGWRFSLIEMQALAAELLERFEFGLPEEKYDIMRVPAGIMIPLVRDKMNLGIAMPLRVSVAQ